MSGRPHGHAMFDGTSNIHTAHQKESIPPVDMENMEPIFHRVP